MDVKMTSLQRCFNCFRRRNNPSGQNRQKAVWRSVLL